jgi:hypothetical protein
MNTLVLASTAPGTARSGKYETYTAAIPSRAVGQVDGSVRELTESAERADVRRLVLLSGRGEEEAQAAEEVVTAGSIEQALGRPAKDFSAFVRDNVAAWAAQAAQPVR